MFAHDEGTITLEEQFHLPTFVAYGADGSALDAAHNYDPKYFVQQEATR